MDEHQVLNYKWKKGIKEVFPAHDMVKNWLFTEDTEEEANLANAMAIVAEKSGMTVNDLQHIFPAVLRMLKNDTAWSKQQLTFRALRSWWQLLTSSRETKVKQK